MAKKKTNKFLIAVGIGTWPQILCIQGPEIEEEFGNSQDADFLCYTGDFKEYTPDFGLFVYECSAVPIQLAKKDDRHWHVHGWQEYDYSDGEFRELKPREWTALKQGDDPWEATIPTSEPTHGMT